MTSTAPYAMILPEDWRVMAKHILYGSRYDSTMLNAGKVAKETRAFYLVDKIEGCPFSFPDKVRKSDVLVEMEDAAKLIRCLWSYMLLRNQHDAVVQASTDTLGESREAILSMLKAAAAKEIPRGRANDVRGQTKLQPAQVA